MLTHFHTLRRVATKYVFSGSFCSFKDIYNPQAVKIVNIWNQGKNIWFSFFFFFPLPSKKIPAAPQTRHLELPFENVPELASTNTHRSLREVAWSLRSLACLEWPGQSSRGQHGPGLAISSCNVACPLASLQKEGTHIKHRIGKESFSIPKDICI